jgi:hypothetical protein
VNKLKPPPPGKQLDYFDAGMPGLVLRLSYGGKKTWRALHYVKTVGKDSKRRTEPRTHALGPILNLKTAREKSTSVSCRPAKGPSRAEAGTFKQIAADWIREYVDEKGLRSKGEIERHLKSYVYPQCEHRLIHEIRRLDVNKLLDDIKNKKIERREDQYNSPLVRDYAIRRFR